MASLIYESKRDLFTVNVCESTPPCTKYNIPSWTDKFQKPQEDTEPGKAPKSNFAKTTRDEYGSYLKVGNTNTPNSTKYLIDNLPGMFGPVPTKNPSADSALYKPSSNSKLTVMISQKQRWADPKIVKDNIGPGLYTPAHTYTSGDKGVEAYSFERTDRPALSRPLKGACTGAYTPQIDSKGRKDLGDPTKFDYSAILNGTKGYRPKGFSVVPRFEDRKIPRIAISDKYMKKMEEEKAKNLEEDEKERKKKIRSTWAKGPQFLLFDVSRNKVPGPGSYSPTTIKDFRTGNVKLGHKMPVPGGRGVEGEAIGDDDSFQNQAELVGKALVNDTGDDTIDKLMSDYRKKIEREVRGGQLTEAPGVEELESMHKRLFFDMPTPGFPVDHFHDKKVKTKKASQRKLLNKTV
jgi:hypothetical protein